MGGGSVIATVNGAAGVAMPRAGDRVVTAQAPGSTAASNANNRLVATAFGTQTRPPGPGAPPRSRRGCWSNNRATRTPGRPTGDRRAATRGRNFMDLTPGDGEQILGRRAPGGS